MLVVVQLSVLGLYLRAGIRDDEIGIATPYDHLRACPDGSMTRCGPPADRQVAAQVSSMHVVPSDIFGSV